METVSVLTLVKGRMAALNNLLEGLSQSTQLPDELIVIFMNEPIRDLPSMPFTIRSHQINRSGYLPLAAARNLAAQEASGALLIFLDVDCIPAPDLIAQYQMYGRRDGLLSGQIRYLEKNATATDNFMATLNVLSTADPIRKDLTLLPYSLFWSLNFACSKKLYKEIGGFDESYSGYGAEDTDFSFSAQKNGVPIQNVSACAYHQYHESFSPPLNHFIDIIGNAKRFYQKWGQWPMEGWLKAFFEMGLVNWMPGEITIQRMPTSKEIDRALKG